ncbi:MAG: hypothetical protein C4305_09830 [Thermoleophilia bacterium]
MSEPNRIQARPGTERDRPRSAEAWRVGVARLGVALCVAAAVLVALVYFPRALDCLDAKASENAALNFDDREVGGGNALSVDKDVLYEARALIPPRASYRFFTGPRLHSSNPLTAPHIGEFARFFLMPRRPDDEARWIICYGCDLGSLGGRFHLLWQGQPGMAVGRLAG